MKTDTTDGTENLNSPLKGQFSTSIWWLVLAGLALLLLAFPLYVANLALANWLLPDPKDAESAKQTLTAIALFIGTGGAGTTLLGASGMIKRSLALTAFKGQRQQLEHHNAAEIEKEAALKTIETSHKKPISPVELAQEERNAIFQPITGGLPETVIADFADAPGGNADGDL